MARRRWTPVEEFTHPSLPRDRTTATATARDLPLSVSGSAPVKTWNVLLQRECPQVVQPSPGSGERVEFDRTHEPVASCL